MQVCIITTGGTIDKDYPRSTGGYAFEIDEPAIIRILDQQTQLKERNDIQYEIVSVCRKDSMEITSQDREKICNIIRERPFIKRFLITHGTDTLIETAQYIDKNGCCAPEKEDTEGKVVVCTGAMKPERFKDSDATFNVGGAFVGLGVLPLPTSPFSNRSSVYICMGGVLLDCRKCTRDEKTGVFKKKTAIKDQLEKPPSKLPSKPPPEAPQVWFHDAYT